jgi:hypothetical protein
MKPTPTSFWDYTQLALLRFLSIFLALMDRILNVRWGEQMLAHMAERWQERLEKLDQEIAALEKERHRSQVQAEALVIHAATIYLAGRQMAHEELRFDPAIPRDEEILDATIEMLVKQRLATIESQEVRPGHFVYNVGPDWAAIHKRIHTVAEEADPELAEWFRESLKLIEEVLLPKPEPQIEHAFLDPHQE